MALISRAETLTGNKRKTEFFSDFLNDFDKTPVGNQLARITNEQAVNQSLRNLIKTNVGERPYQPDIGSNVLASFFDNITKPTLNSLQFYIENTINNNEPRVNLLDVAVSAKVAPKGFRPFDDNEHEIEVTIVYNLINNPDPITLVVILKRVR